MRENFLFTGIGNAAIDVICSVPERFLDDLALPRGSCAFPDRAQVEAIENALAARRIEKIYEPGGSAANTASAIAALGGQAAFIGKTADDAYGRRFAESLDAWDIARPVAPVAAKEAQSTSIYTFITPDRDRSFASYQGAADHLRPDDIPEDLIRRSACLYVDGYVLAAAHGAETAMQALDLAGGYGSLRVFNPSALSVISSWRGALEVFMNRCDGVICNEQEAMAMTGGSSVEAAATKLAEGRKFAAVTLGEQGAIVRMEGAQHWCANPPMFRPLVNTNGAGDNFAGGFLFGLMRGWAPERALRLGLACAVNVLGEAGPRPAASLEMPAKAA